MVSNPGLYAGSLGDEVEATVGQKLFLQVQVFLLLTCPEIHRNSVCISSITDGNWLNKCMKKTISHGSLHHLVRNLLKNKHLRRAVFLFSLSSPQKANVAGLPNSLSVL